MVVHTVHKGCRYQEYMTHMKNVHRLLMGWVGSRTTVPLCGQAFNYC